MKFYFTESIRQGWKVRELKRQIKSALFQRLALSTDKKGCIGFGKRGASGAYPQDILRDPFVLEFAGLPQKKQYKEGELEAALKANMEKFLLELGRGVCLRGAPVCDAHWKQTTQGGLGVLSLHIEMLCSDRLKTGVRSSMEI